MKHDKNWDKNTAQVFSLETRHHRTPKLPALAASVWSMGLLGVAGLDTSPVMANPSVLLIYPSDEFTPRNTLRVNSDLYTRAFKTTTFGTGGFSYGFGSGSKRAFGRSEFGLDYVAAAPFGTVSFANRTRFNAKTLLFDSPRSGVRVVAGAWGVGATGNTLTSSAFPPNVAYILGSKRFKGGRIQAGLARALSRQSVLTTPGGNSDRTFLQLGFERAISRRVRFRLDYYSGKSNISALVPGVLIVLSQQAAIRLGYIRYNDASIAPSRNQFVIAFDLLTEKSRDDAEIAVAAAMMESETTTSTTATLQAPVLVSSPRVVP